MILAFAATVALLVWMGFFMMGSLPLLILKHDTPVDARFIRGLFNLYYWAVIVTSTTAAIFHALADRPLYALLMACIALFAVSLRQAIVLRMDHLRSTMTPTDSPAIRRFRKLHITGMLLNVGQLGGIVFVMTQVRL